jgi:hypothetical protein
LAAGEQAAGGPHSCVTLGGAGRGTGYRIVSVREQLGGGPPGKAARIHLRWRDAERRFVVVGLEREE